MRLRQELQEVTGRDFGRDVERWARYVAVNPFPAEEGAALRRARYEQPVAGVTGTASGTGERGVLGRLRRWKHWPRRR